MGMPSAVGLASGTRSNGLPEAFASAWARADQFVAALRPEAWLACPRPELTTPLFHVVTSASLAAELLGKEASVSSTRMRERFGPAKALGFRRDGARARGEDWPAPAEALRYRDLQRAQLLDALHELDDAAQDDLRLAPFQRLLEQELLIQEDLLVLLRHLDPGLRQPSGSVRAPSLAPSGMARRHQLPPGRARLGVEPAQCSWAQPHERAGREAKVAAFVIDALPVVIGELFEFVLAGGYEQAEHWRPDDWDWLTSARLRHPVAWVRRGGEWTWRGPFGELPLTRVFDWPASVSLAEARAFARWRGARLPSEAEWRWAAQGSFGGATRAQPWGEAPLTPRRARHAEPWAGPAPVGSHPSGASAFGVQELVGNGWEWVDQPVGEAASSSRSPSRAATLLGLSWASDARLLRPGLRLVTTAHDPWRFTKFRLVHPDQVS